MGSIVFKMDLLLVYAMDGDVKHVKNLLDANSKLMELDIFYLVGTTIRRHLVDNRKRENMIEIVNHILDQPYVDINVLIENKDDLLGRRLVDELKELKRKRRNNLIDKII